LLKRLQTPKGQPTKEASPYSIVPHTSYAHEPWLPAFGRSCSRKPRLDRLCENWGESGREGRIDNDAAFSMSYIRGEDREQASFLPARIDDYVGAESSGPGD
jgi:hypothetical protein